jgi:hypothetical protein
MSIKELSKKIESRNFASMLGLANNARMFRELAREEPAVRQLAEDVKNPTEAKELLARVESLVREQDDIRFRNDRDAAIAIYICTLSESNPAYGRLAASLALSVPRLWWARQAAIEIFGSGFTSGTSPTQPATLVIMTGSLDATSNDKDTVFLAEVDRGLVRDAQLIDAGTTQISSQPDAVSVVEVGKVKVSNPAAPSSVVTP